MLEVNNIPIPAPSEFRPGIQDIEDAGRNAQGDMMIDRIATKRKLEMKWDYLSAQELSTLLKLVSNPFFFVKYPDPETAKFEIKTFYCGDRNMGMYMYSKGQAYWSDVSFNFIEK